MPDTEAARLIISAAKRDLKALEHMQDSGAFPDEIFGFHAQQAVEKLLKAWLSLLDQGHPRTHNVRQLILLLEQAGVDAEFLWNFIELTAFAVQFRYEAYEDLDAALDRKSLLSDIRQLVIKVEHFLRDA